MIRIFRIKGFSGLKDFQDCGVDELKKQMMRVRTDFSHLVDSVYKLPIEFKEELMNLLEHNISEIRRDEMLKSYNEAKAEQKEGKLKFSANVDELMGML